MDQCSGDNLGSRITEKAEFCRMKAGRKVIHRNYFLSEIWHFHWLSNNNEVEYLVEILLWTVVAAVVLSISVTIVSASFTMMVMSAATPIITTSMETATSTIVIISTVILSVVTLIGFVWPLFAYPSGVEWILISTRWFPMIIVCRIGFYIDPVFPAVAIWIWIVVTSSSALSLIIISLEGMKDMWEIRTTGKHRIIEVSQRKYYHSANPQPLNKLC